MLEAEISFIDDLQQIMDIVERLVQRMVTRLRNSIVGEELLSVRDLHKFNKSEVTRSGLEKRWVRLIEGKWPRIPYTAAVLLLQEAVSRNSVCFEFPVSLGTGLQAEHEKYIADTVGNGGPVFVTDYPRDSKAFYMAPTPSPQGCLSSGPTVSCFDLLIPDMCEIAGGSMREHRLDAMLTTLENRGMLLSESTTQPREGEIEGSRQGSVPIDLSRVPESLRWYVDLRRYGSVPHGGFGLGFDRLLCYLSGVSSIRDVVTFPRWHGRCDC
jgi:asparaginyl-tRNA synthetase